jgi:hypothetical protein
MILRIFESSVYTLTFAAVGVTFFDSFVSAGWWLTLAAVL